MPQACKVCANPKRSQIDQALATGDGSERNIAQRFGVPYQSVHRHKAKHLPSLLVSLSSRVQAFEHDEILGQVVGLYERSLELLAQAESRLMIDHRPSALSAATRSIREARQTVELMAKLSVAMRDEEKQAAQSVENTANIALDEAIDAALKRRGMQSQGPRVNDPSHFGAMLQLNKGKEDTQDIETIDAEIIED